MQFYMPLELTVVVIHFTFPNMNIYIIKLFPQVIVSSKRDESKSFLYLWM